MQPGDVAEVHFVSTGPRFGVVLEPLVNYGTCFGHPWYRILVGTRKFKCKLENYRVTQYDYHSDFLNPTLFGTVKIV